MYNYNEDLKIDILELDKEWAYQPRKLMQWSELLAEAKKSMRKIKTEIPVKEAEIELQIRKNPTAFTTIEKITESVIKACVETHPEIVELNKKLTEAEYEVDLLDGAVKAFEQRKTALENEVKLLGQQYFSAPKVPKEVTQEMIQNIEGEFVRRKLVEKSVAMTKRIMTRSN